MSHVVDLQSKFSIRGLAERHVVAVQKAQILADTKKVLIEPLKIVLVSFSAMLMEKRAYSVKTSLQEIVL